MIRTIMVRCLEASNGCLEFQGSKDKDGYGHLVVNGKDMRAHRYAWILQYGEIPPGKCVLHKCDNRKCCNTDHLFLGTRSDNNADTVSKGRQRSAQGTAKKAAKLTEENVRYIRANANGPHGTRSKMARQFGVSTSIVSEIISGKRWHHV